MVYIPNFYPHKININDICIQIGDGPTATGRCRTILHKCPWSAGKCRLHTYEYFPLIPKEEYRKSFMKQVIHDYFDNSYKNAVAFFVKEKGLSQEELDELVKMIKDRK